MKQLNVPLLLVLKWRFQISNGALDSAVNCQLGTFDIYVLLIFLQHQLGVLQARAEGGAVGAWAPAPFPLDAQSALLSRQLLFFFYYYYFFVIKRPFVKACPI